LETQALARQLWYHEAADRAGVRLLVGHCVRVGAHGLALAAIADLGR
jgi:hypothetical protein